jgi:NhaA family Na+:H+ antiporter
VAVLRSERLAAVLLLAAATLGLGIANSPLGPAALALQHARIPVLDLSAGHLVTDGLLAVFFFVAAVELRHELTVGELNSPARALRPAIAAAGGVLVPIAIYLAVTAGSGTERGWPIPTATDIAFALGVLAVFGRGLPRAVRSFLLALAILDDIVAIGFIAVLFTDGLDAGMLLAALAGAVAFGALSLLLRTRARVLIGCAMVLIAVLTWWFVLRSGVHPTIAGVALGLAMSRPAAARARHALEPVTNGVILPVFAFSAALVPFPAVGIGELSPAFWGIAIALPVGKLIGITAGGLIARPRDGSGLATGDLVAVAAVGGVGFTVSLLMNELAFADHTVADQGTLAVLLGSIIALVAGGALVAWRARAHRRSDADAQRE